MKTQLIKGSMLLLLVLAFICQTCNAKTLAVQGNERNTVPRRNRRSTFRGTAHQALIKLHAQEQGERKTQEKSTKAPKAPKSSKSPKSTKSSKSHKSLKSTKMSLVGSSSMNTTTSSAVSRHGSTATFVSLAAASIAIYSL